MPAASPDRERTLVVTGLVLVQVFFGLHYIAAKLVLVDMEPRTYAVLRATAAAVLVLGLALAARRPFPPLADTGRLALGSLLGVAVNQVCFVEGLSRTSATHSALLNAAIPVLTLAAAAALGRERITPAKALSLAVATAGVALILRPGRDTFGTAAFAGDVLTLVNGTSYALFLVLCKRVFGRNDALASTAVLLCAGAVAIALLGARHVAAFRPAEVSPAAWGWLAFVVLFPTAGAYLLNNWALARADASLVAFFIYLQPLIAASLAFVRLGERPGPSTLAGGALVCTAVFLALRPASRAASRLGPVRP